MLNEKQNTKTGQIPEYLQEKVRVFKFNNQTITRNLELEILDEGIMVNYIYQTSINKWNTQFKLYDISAVFIKQLLGSQKIKKVIEYKDYQFNLRKNENSAIIVIEI